MKARYGGFTVSATVCTRFFISVKMGGRLQLMQLFISLKVLTTFQFLPVLRPNYYIFKLPYPGSP